MGKAWPEHEGAGHSAVTVRERRVPLLVPLTFRASLLASNFLIDSPEAGLLGDGRSCQADSQYLPSRAGT